MLQTLQIIALIQGLFLMVILFKNRKDYKQITFWLFIGCIISILLYIIGDDDNNLFKSNADWFLFDSSLFITFLFLFFRYFKSNKSRFSKKDFLFFIPNFIYLSIESYEIINSEETIFIEIPELLNEFVFLAYLLYILFDLFKKKSSYWILYFVIPIVLLMSISYVNDVLGLLSIDPIVISQDKDFATYLLLIIAFLFYFITFNLMVRPKEFLPQAKIKKYKTSNLNPELIDKCKNALLNAMENDKMYLDPKLSIHSVSKKTNIPRQYLSEVLNIHLNKSFQDYVNTYRINAFIESLQNNQYEHYTLFGIASEVGFNSKSSFNSTFKKNKGLTPTQFKNSLSSNGLMRTE